MKQKEERHITNDSPHYAKSIYQPRHGVAK
jgi:hypothetical protein